MARAFSSLGISGPSSRMLAAGLSSPLTGPCLGSAPIVERRLLSMFFFFSPFLFASFPLPPGEPFLGFGQLRPSQGPHPHPRRPRGQHPRTALSLPTAGKLRAFPFHSTFSAPPRPGWWEGEQGRARGGRPSPPACAHLSQCPSAGDFPPGLFNPLPTPVAARLQPDGGWLPYFREGAADGWWLLSLPDLKAQFPNRKGCALHKY